MTGESNPRFNGANVNQSLDAEFTRRLHAGELEFETERDAEIIRGVNLLGQAIEVRRPSTEAAEKFAALDIKPAYLITVTPRYDQPEQEGHSFVLLEDGAVIMLGGDDSVYDLLDGPDAEQLFQGVFW